MDYFTPPKVNTGQLMDGRLYRTEYNTAKTYVMNASAVGKNMESHDQKRLGQVIYKFIQGLPENDAERLLEDYVEDNLTLKFKT